MSEEAIRRDWAGSFAAADFPLRQWLGGSQASGVFLTEFADGSQKAVIKLIPEHDRDAAARAAAWEVASTLSHPNLMKVFTHGRCEIDGVACHYVVTEYAEEVLAEILRERPLSPEETRDMLSPTLAALAYLHAKGLVHGRLNPSNIMAVGDTLKLTTYGVCPAGAAVVARPARTVCDAPETENGLIVPASDIWSFGATLVEVLTRYPPVWNRAKAADPTVPQSMPEPFASFARKCLRSDPTRRITISEITARLDPAKASPNPVMKPPGLLPAKRRMALWFPIAGLLLTAFGIWYSFSYRKQPAAPVEQTQPVPTAVPSPQVRSSTSAIPSQPPVAPQPQQSQPEPESAPPREKVPPQPAAQADNPSPQPAEEHLQNPEAAGTTINPAIVSQILPDIVPSALKTINGTLRVTVQLTVGANGKVTDATLLSPGPSKYFASKSLEAARQWKFKPSQNGAPNNWTLEFQYRQIGIQVVAEPSPL